VSVPIPGSGFNRTLDLDGVSNDVLYSSTSFSSPSCTAKVTEGPTPIARTAGEFHAIVEQATGASARFDGAQCDLKAIAIRKTEPGSPFEAEIRFQFESCAKLAGFPGQPVASSSAVVLGLRSDPTLVPAGLAGTSLQLGIVPWMKAVCGWEKKAPVKKSNLAVTSEHVLKLFGPGKCEHASPSDEKVKAHLVTLEACKGDCARSILEHKYLKEATGVCTGFAFSEAEKCITYTGAISAEKSVASADAAWKCFGMKLEDASSQAAKTTKVDPEAQKKYLHVRDVFSGPPLSMSTAKLMEIKPQAGDDKCPSTIPATWWFMLQDDLGTYSSLGVPAAEWDELMGMLPDPLTNAKPTRSSLTIDRVLVTTGNPGNPAFAAKEASWGRECIKPKVEKLCNNKQLVNSIVTGVVVPVGGWLVVSWVQKILPSNHARIQSNDLQYDPADVPRCSLQGVAILCIVAMLACAGLAFGCSTAVGYAFGAAGCKHGPREMVVVGFATGIPAALAMIFGLVYLNRSADKHAITQQSGAAAYAMPKGHKLMLVEVQEGQDVMSGKPINPDIMNTGTSAMVSYNASHSPGAIRIESNAMASH